MNNAGIEAGGRFSSPPELWRRIVDVNFWGAIHGVQAFVPGMMASGRPGARDQHGLEAGHHDAARQHALQRLEGRPEGR